MNPNQQPRLPVGARKDGVASGGRWASKPVPDLTAGDPLGFNQDVDEPASPKPFDWDKRVVRVANGNIVFERRVETDDAGNDVVTVTSDCDGPELMLLNRKGDIDYWSGDNWRHHTKDRRIWAADIAVNMLRQGLVSTGHGTGVEGLQAVVNKATVGALHGLGPNALTGVVAQIRALRLLQSMTNGSKRWHTTLGGSPIPTGTYGLMLSRFKDVLGVYQKLPKPPWDDTTPPGLPWGPQLVAGHASLHTWNGGARESMFVGENNDLLWRALTETDNDGLSPLKAGLGVGGFSQWSRHMIVAAALYNETAERQLTSDLFVGVGFGERVSPFQRVEERNDALIKTRDVFLNALTPETGECCWTAEQQQRIRGFVDVIENLEP